MILRDRCSVLCGLALAALGWGIGSAEAWRSALYPSDWQPPSGETASFATNKLIQDFSYAGFHAGEQPIPNVSGPLIDVTKPPYNADKTGGADATVAIQSAINAVQSVGGGVVWLPAGLYSIHPQGANTYALLISASNVVLRGAGVSATYLLNTSTNMRSKSIILVNGPAAAGFYSSGVASTAIAQDLPGPASEIPVISTSGFSPGQWIVVRADCTDAWITEHNEPDWLGHGSQLHGVAYFRQVVSVSAANQTITLNAPTRYYLKTRDNARVVRLSSAPLLGCGLEDFSIGNVQHGGTGWGESDYTVAGTAAYDVHDSYAIRLVRSRDSWVRNVATFQPAGNTTTCHLLSNGILLSECTQVTLTNLDLQHAQYGGGGGNGYMYRLGNASDCLVDHCRSTFTRHGFVLSQMAATGNVFHECIDKDSGQQTGDTGLQTTAGRNSDHHMHFSHANLVDDCTGDNSGWEARYRPYGSVPLHDLTAAHSVYWNTRGIGSGPSYVVTSEQSRYGYVIGTRGTRSGVSLSTYGGTKCDPVDHVEGIGQGDTLEPYSLYEDQLSRRLGLPHVRLPENLTLGFPTNSVRLEATVQLGVEAAPSNSFTITWHVLSADGDVLFSSTNVANPLVTFAARGTNVIEAVVTANGFQASAQIIIFLAAPPGMTNASIAPEADTYVRDGTFANDNYGIDTVLQLKKNATTSYTRFSFLRFDVTALTNPGPVFLELHSPSPPAPGLSPTMELHLVTNDVWSETGLSWNTQPSMGPIIASWLMSTNGVDRVDVTSTALAEAAGDQRLSLGLLIADPFSDTVYSYYSREAPAFLQPRLVTEVADPTLSFDVWIAGFTNLNSAQVAPAADPDGDGMNNAEEFLFALDPSVPDSTAALSLLVVSGGVTLKFPERKRLPSGMYYVIETTPTLWPADWRAAPGIEFSAGADLGEAILRIAFIPTKSDRQAFYRLRIVLGP